MNLHITEPKKERFRTIPGQVQYFPEDVDVNKYEVVGYLVGERIDRFKGLSIELFDQIRFIKFSSNARNKRKFMQVEGYRKHEKQYTVLILKLK